MALTDDRESRDAAFRCAPWTRDHQVDPVGSAGTYDGFLLVESPQPWPDDVSSIPALAGAATRDPRVRVLAVVPRVEDDTGLLRVVHWRRDEHGRFAGLDHRCDPAGMPELLARLVDDPAACAAGAVGEAPPEVLVCTHGRRDACCGRWGTLLHAEVAARWDGVRTWRCSHTGGHRFAPTGLTFPDGRAWASLDPDVLDGIVTRSIDPVALRAHYRGSTALDEWGQVVERALFERFGWSWHDHELQRSRTTVAPDGRSARVDLRWRAPDGRTGRAAATVEVRRDIPVLVCGLPPDQATKTSTELALRDLDVDVDTRPEARPDDGAAHPRQR
jgi:hypothetical protein